MRRLCLTIACLLSAVAWTQASAQDLSKESPKPARSHPAKPKSHPAASRTASLNDAVRFSDPYAPPEGTTIARRNAFPVYSYPTPTEPKAGLGLTAGDDGLGHYTGGLKWGF